NEPQTSLRSAPGAEDRRVKSAQAEAQTMADRSDEAWEKARSDTLGDDRRHRDLPARCDPDVGPEQISGLDRAAGPAEDGRQMKIAPHVARKAVARKTKKTMPHVAQEVTPQPKQITPQPLPKAVVRKTNRTMPHVARSTENVIKISDYATRGTIHGNGSKQK